MKIKNTIGESLENKKNRAIELSEDFTKKLTQIFFGGE